MLLSTTSPSTMVRDGLAASGGPGLVAGLAVGLQAGGHAVEEAGEGEPVPVLECVAGVCQAGASSLVCEDGEVVDEVGVLGPAGWDDAVGVPDVFVVDPGDDVVEPHPELEAEVGVGAAGRVPGSGETSGVPECLELFGCAARDDPQRSRCASG